MVVEKDSIPLGYRVKIFDIGAGRPVVILNEDDAREKNLFLGDRVELVYKTRRAVAIVDTSNTLVHDSEIGVFSELAEELGLEDGEFIHIVPMMKPASVEYIKRKLDGQELSEKEIYSVIDDLMENRLSEAELAVFVAAVYAKGLNSSETVALTKAIVNSGETLKLDKAPIVDKHCVGGVAGNRTTMVVVPIMAAAGAYMPKTSSRAITSAAGTADTMEVLADVNLTINEIRDIVLKTHGVIAWGGGAHLASADDKLIRIRHPFRLDPRGMLLASIMAKKYAVGAQYLVIDIPVGRGAKFEDPQGAKDLARDFLDISSKLGIKSEVLITDGSDPVGFGVGPALEVRDVLKVLQGDGPRDLMDKASQLAGSLLESSGMVEKGAGYDTAMNLIKSGKAFNKFREIVEAQGGNPHLRVDDLPIGSHKVEVYAETDGRVEFISNRKINRIARAAGSPKDKGAGVYLMVERGDKIHKGDVLFEIYSDSEAKLEYALRVAQELNPVELQRIVLGKYY